MSEQIPILGVLAHPDDEYTQTYALTHKGVLAHTLTATLGKTSTINRTDDPFFVKSGRRAEEQRRSLIHLGIPQERQRQLDLPDGQLPAWGDKLSAAIVGMVLDHDIKVLVTMDADGFDGHPDHIQVYNSAVDAITTLSQQHKREVGHLVLNNRNQGKIRLEADEHMQALKLGSMSLHTSQFDVRPADVAPHPGDLHIGGYYVGKEFYEQFEAGAPYWRLIEAETYDPYDDVGSLVSDTVLRAA